MISNYLHKPSFSNNSIYYSPSIESSNTGCIYLFLSLYLKDYLSSMNIPEDMDTGLDKLKELALERDDIACQIAEQREKLEANAKLSGPMVNQQASVSTGGGAFILTDYAETERKETNFFLTSLNTRWKDTWSDLLNIQTHLGELSVKWNLYETVCFFPF